MYHIKETNLSLVLISREITVFLQFYGVKEGRHEQEQEYKSDVTA